MPPGLSMCTITARVLLDFDSYTNVYIPGVDTNTNEHVYTPAERDAIQARLEMLYHGPDPDDPSPYPRPRARAAPKQASDGHRAARSHGSHVSLWPLRTGRKAN